MFEVGNFAEHTVAAAGNYQRTLATNRATHTVAVETGNRFNSLGAS